MFSCGQTSTKLDIGKLDGNLYSNSYFALSLQIDTFWIIMNRQQLNQMMAARQELIHENTNRDIGIPKGASILLSMTIDTIENMPQILISSLDLSQFPKISSEKSYLEDYYKKTADLYKNFNINFSTSDITIEKLNSKSFFTNLITIKNENFIAYQKRYSLKIKDQLLNIMVNYKSPEQLAQSNSLLNKIKWD